jgi:hypothetical protein
MHALHEYHLLWQYLDQSAELTELGIHQQEAQDFVAQTLC